MSLNTLVVSNLPTTSQPDNTPVSQLAGKMGEGLVAEIHGQYFTQTYRKKMFIATQPAAGVIALPTGAATASYALANPPTSTSLVVPVYCVILETVVPGTPVLGGLVWSLVPSNATAVTGTAISSQDLSLSSTPATSVGKALTTATLPITPTVFLPVEQKWTGAITTIPRTNVVRFDFNGTLILAPGASMGLQQVAADTTNPTLQVGVVWYEVPA